MAKRSDHEPLQVQRTRTSAALVAITVAVVFGVLLIIFIAQNDKKVPIHFLGAYGQVSEALALVAATVAGAALVLLVSVSRVVQLRVTGRRHNRAVAKQQAAVDSAAETDESTGATPPEGGAQPVEPEN
jgi:lipopolysaccharide assembly protein A